MATIALVTVAILFIASFVYGAYQLTSIVD